MQFFRLKRTIVAGAVALSLGLGAVAAGGVAEVREALAQEDDTELDGVVEVLPEGGLVGTWQVSGKSVQVTEATEIDQVMGSVGVGIAVEVEGTTQPDGSITASEIEVEDLE
jgi:hypothetical protein